MRGALGLHIISTYRGALGTPRICKLLDPSPEYVREVRERVGPRCLIIVRWYQPYQVLDDSMRRAFVWYEQHQAAMRAMTSEGADHYLGFESLNEVPDSEAVAYCEYEVARLRLMHADGYHAVVGNWSVGTPDLPVWAIYRRVLDAMWPTDYVGLHSYWSDHADIDNPWHCARWQFVPELAGRQIVVTECGRDVVEGRGQAGWRKSCNAEEYLADLRKYNALLERYPNVVGACVFTGGNVQAWEDFDVNDLWPRVVEGYGPPDAPEPPQAAPVPYDGRFLEANALAQHVAETELGQLRAVIIHHTASRLEDWHGAESMATLACDFGSRVWYDEGGQRHVGWDAGPHLFVEPTGCWLFTPLSQDGVGVNAWNWQTRHIEIIGNFTDAEPSPALWWQGAFAAACVLRKAGLSIRALRYHGELEATECPGRAFIRVFEAFRHDVQGLMDLPQTEPVASPMLISQKARWWAEEMERKAESGDFDQAEVIRLSLIQLLYRLENVLKALS